MLMPILTHTHLVNFDGWSPSDIDTVFERAVFYLHRNASPNKQSDVLHGRTILNAFFEPSTRTQISFDIAAQRLGANVVNFNADTSSLAKGETFEDTLKTLNAMHLDALIIRHTDNEAAALASVVMNGSVINAGTGTSAHPTQALLDALTIREHKHGLMGLKIAIVGDIAHSRVAASNIQLLSLLGVEVRVVGPDFLIPKDIDVPVFHTLRDGLKDVDAIMMLRLQKERLAQPLGTKTGAGAGLDEQDYIRHFQLNAKTLAFAPDDAMILHPGPVNRGVEMTDDIADHARSFILRQVEMGVAVRMAVLEGLIK